MQTISYAVLNLCHLEQLKKSLYAVGEKHVDFASRGFKPEYWDISHDAIECALAKHIASLENFSEQEREDATRMWRRLSMFITWHMKRGYFDRMGRVEDGKGIMPISFGGR